MIMQPLVPDGPLLSVEQFLEQSEELPEGGRWTELQEGAVIVLSPPTTEHGTAVFNLTKRLAAALQSADQPAYACFELGLILRRSPGTLRRPAVSLFSSSPKFAHCDAVATAEVPDVVIEVASSRDRRLALHDRIAAYHNWTVNEVWVLDPAEKCVYVSRRGGATNRLAEQQTLHGRSPLEEFQIPVAELFAEPEWWLGKKQK